MSDDTEIPELQRVMSMCVAIRDEVPDGYGLAAIVVRVLDDTQFAWYFLGLGVKQHLLDLAESHSRSVAGDPGAASDYMPHLHPFVTRAMNRIRPELPDNYALILFSTDNVPLNRDGMVGFRSSFMSSASAELTHRVLRVVYEAKNEIVALDELPPCS